MERLPGILKSSYGGSCNEKTESYLMLSRAGLPVLKSVILSWQELKLLDSDQERIIHQHLNSGLCMVRYLYHEACCDVRNGGKIIPAVKCQLLKEASAEASLWLLEPVRREDNRYCCNICLNRQQGNLHIEILGRGFDISDLNKGKIAPHQYADIPYPIEKGTYGEWWKWAVFYFCGQKEYEHSITLRKKRLKEFHSQCEINFDPSYRPADLCFYEKVFEIVDRLEGAWPDQSMPFYNVSCSCLKNGRLICWDIQTPKGKLRAYSQGNS